MNIISLVFLLLITHWSNAASLHSENKFLDHQNSSEDSIHSQFPVVKRRRRWVKNNDNDEVEIPVNETLLTVTNSDDITLLTSMNSETTESNSSILENFDDLMNSTMSFLFNTTTTTTFEVHSDENTTMKSPLLSREDSNELNQTNISIIEQVLQDNQTDMNETIFSSTIFNEFSTTNSTDKIEFTTMNSTDKNESTIEQIPSLFPIILNQTTDQIEPVTTVIPSNITTISSNTTEDNEWDLSTVLINNLNISQKDAIEILPDSNETSILSSKSITIPICDHSCQCLKECPYGFEILNDTCLCDPPCKNYQCSGNDTCIVTDEGEPLCQPKNGTKHDRPIGCYQPRDAGYHDDNSRYYNRWYYNPDQDTCHLFVYRGLGGNENNFRTLNECHLECITCAPLPDRGECLGNINMWYYDNKKSECRQFEYSGCKGNENKFLKKEQCIDTCVNRIVNN